MFVFGFHFIYQKILTIIPTIGMSYIVHTNAWKRCREKELNQVSIRNKKKANKNADLLHIWMFYCQDDPDHEFSSIFFFSSKINKFLL